MNLSHIVIYNFFELNIFLTKEGKKCLDFHVESQ